MHKIKWVLCICFPENWRLSGVWGLSYMQATTMVWAVWSGITWTHNTNPSLEQHDANKYKYHSFHVWQNTVFSVIKRKLNKEIMLLRQQW